MNEEKMREDFEAWCAIKSDSDYREGAWDAWQAACASKQKEIDELVEAMKEVLRISDRKHAAWDKVYALIEKGESK